MKNFTFLKASVWMISLSMTTCVAMAQTAVQSGAWSDPNTWDGGNVPSFNLGNNTTVEIPDGITVSLNNVLIVDGPGILGVGGAVLDVEGELESAGAGDLILTAGTVSGDGEIMVEDLLFSGGTFSFTGDVNAKNVTSSSAVSLAATLTIEEMFTLSSGIFTVSSGSFIANQDVDIMINGGTLTLTGGTVNLTNTYNVTYAQASSITGFEIDGPGLNDVTINVGTANTVTLSSDLDVNGTLTLDEGDLILNGNDLTINGALAASTDGEIVSTDESSISLNTPNGIGGMLYFSTTGNDVDDFTINVGDDNTVMLASDLTVHGTLNLTSGYLDIDDNDLEINNTGTIIGADSTSYIITNIDGSLGMTVTSGGSTFTNFPVGTVDAYMPVAIQFNSGSSAGLMRVGVDEGVLANGTSGNDLANDQPVVNGTWFIEPDVTVTDVDANIRFMWMAAQEVNGFDNANAYVGHYESGSWEMEGSVSAATESNGLWMLTATNITSFSPFAIFGENAVSGIEEIASNVIFNVYPNPTSDRINIDFLGDVAGVVNMDIVDMNGRVMGNYKLTGNETSVDVNFLPAGNYSVRFFNENLNAVKKLVKL